MSYFVEMASSLGMSVDLFIIVFIVVLIWSAIWKLLALWKSARNGAFVWFVFLALLNTLGILPILYIYVFSKSGIKSKKK